ncbi:MAG: bestrophin family ion channel [Burkholderiaceae bacterium]
MIVRDRPTVWEVFFVLRGSILPRILPSILGVAALSLAIVLANRAGGLKLPPIPAVALTVIGAALAIFAAFRNAAAYDRWWEARKLMGQIVIETRNLARQRVYIEAHPDDDAPRRIALRCVAFIHLLSDFFRDRPISPNTARYLQAGEREALEGNLNQPTRLLELFSVDIAALLAASRLAPIQARMMEERVQNLMNGFASAERIKTTPMPFVYTLLVHRTAYLFCCLLPFGLADSSGYWTPLLAGIVSYTFFALDAIGDDLSAPFDRNENSLALDAIARAVEINVLQNLGERDVPAPLEPENYLLT